MSSGRYAVRTTHDVQCVGDLTLRKVTTVRNGIPETYWDIIHGGEHSVRLHTRQVRILSEFLNRTLQEG